jgi:malonyl-CoA O-methyltransferase
MKVQTEFSRYAGDYGNYNVIQQRVIAKLLADIGDERPQRILDLGCGSGTLYNALPWKPEHFLGVDFAPRMLELHPRAADVECVYGDFNDPDLFEHLRFLDFDRIFSASALQWSKDLDRTFAMVASLNAPVSLALFTANTFETLFRTAGIAPILRSSGEIAEAARPWFGEAVETVRYRLAFASTREMFRYIKRSGVSAGRNVLSYKATKRLMEAYPLDYLEFEVVFITTRSGDRRNG